MTRANSFPQLNGAWLDAGRQAGYAVQDDLNGYDQEGFGHLDMTVAAGSRCSADLAYLQSAMTRANLTVVSNALVHRVVFSGDRAVGVAYSTRDGLQAAHADAEIIVSAGAVNSPQLLLLSGIGDADHLASVGVDLVHHQPNVGRNLQDHLCVYVQYACTRPVSLAAAQRPWRKLTIGTQWLLWKNGIGASNQFEVGAFLRSAEDVGHPDIQYHFLPLAIGYEIGDKLPDHSFQVDVDGLRPRSRGTVLIESTDPRVHPRIDPNYLSAPEDLDVLRKGIRLAREIFSQAAFDAFRGTEMAPEAALESDEDLAGYIRQTAQSAYHPACTCAMGDGDEAVVDPSCRVRGLKDLRVVDASIMPSIVSGNLNAPTIMIAEKAADIILDRSPLAPENAAFHADPITLSRPAGAAPDAVPLRDR